MAAAAATIAAAAGTWAFCAWATPLDVSNCIAVAGLALMIVGGPVGVWTGRTTSPSTDSVTNIGLRNSSFVGRSTALLALRERLRSGGSVVVAALYGMGGVGKTALALEYAHRFAQSYDIVWWVDAERASLIGEQLGALAVAARWVAADADSGAAIAAVRRHLAKHRRWLLVFDNARDPHTLRNWLPLGRGHVLITSRHTGWDEVAQKVEVDVFNRNESIDLLRRAVPRLSVTEADELAGRIGDLPLALAQAAGVLAETGMATSTYLDELGRHADRAMSQQPPASYPVSLAAALQISVCELEERAPSALRLLYSCAPLAPEPVPLDILFGGDSEFDAVSDASVLARIGLARFDPDGLRLHRLTQAILLDQLDPSQRQHVISCAEDLLIRGAPDTSDDPAEWSRWSRLLPHIMARNPARSDNPELRELATDAVRYLLNRGEVRAGGALAEGLVEDWRSRYGRDDRITLNAAYHLARALREQGEHERALALATDVLDRYRTLEGPDARSTLAAATGVAASLRALDRPDDALRLDRDTLARKRRVLGDEDPSTLASAVGVGTDLRELGRLAEAEEIDRATLASKKRVLGPDALATLASMANLATDLRLLGRLNDALVMLRDLAARSARVLGEDHPTTLTAAETLQALRRHALAGSE